MKRLCLYAALAAGLYASAGCAASPKVLPGPMPLLAPAAPSAPDNSEPAPTPNVDLHAPDPARLLAKPGPSVAAGLAMQRRSLRDGSGYSPGSSFSDDLQRRSRPAFNQLAPTIGLRVPLE